MSEFCDLLSEFSFPRTDTPSSDDAIRGDELRNGEIYDILGSESDPADKYTTLDDVDDEREGDTDLESPAELDYQDSELDLDVQVEEQNESELLGASSGFEVGPSNEKKVKILNLKFA